ncbi:hypothetical protein PGTUg99_033295 [Puccinia graminis f. sp. tritici]|uniref:Uncharacterized protein n=1 Tax=Puccinia graminis f. sp. tritici TaxID=56615 RepID=A0A5B0MEA8_PUCGR|nr:hypothetical protein PGTUg99_033295 [Puccinia graminis f. sp. tritici]
MRSLTEVDDVTGRRQGTEWKLLVIPELECNDRQQKDCFLGGPLEMWSLEVGDAMVPTSLSPKEAHFERQELVRRVSDA